MMWADWLVGHFVKDNNVSPLHSQSYGGQAGVSVQDSGKRSGVSGLSRSGHGRLRSTPTIHVYFLIVILTSNIENSPDT